MASIFTYDPNPPRVSSPWSTPESMTPTRSVEEPPRRGSSRLLSQSYSTSVLLQDTGITKLEAEPQEGSTEYKLHLLLRPRRTFTSSTTGMDIYGSSQSVPNSSPKSLVPVNLQAPKSSYAPSNITRQMRLQQLTTQLLWRLQQSSPFHSSSPGDLVLPKLPEASPKLGIPAKRAALLPGLEESQGALYEIGVSDDGALVGLIEEELEESLINLKAMAASLGCIVEVLRKVAVGECEWLETSSPSSKKSVARSTLWVTEALVRPDTDVAKEPTKSKPGNGHAQGSTLALVAELEAEALRSQAEQLRITLTGSTTAGKSSLLGTLSTSTLDNGRGKSRLSLLRHRHEISSGVTSSVAQELIGYQRYTDQVSGEVESQVINYATSDASSWIDIHHLAHRLVFMSDSPGQPRYAKSTFRTLVSWKPHWTIVCVPADEDESDTGKVGATSAMGDLASDTNLSVAYIGLCLKLGLPIVISVTKMDLATKSGLRMTLSKVLSTLKAAGRHPVMLSNTTVPSTDLGPDLQHIGAQEQAEVDRLLGARNFTHKTVPIILTSALTGQGIGKLHALLNSLPVLPVKRSFAVPGLEQDTSSTAPSVLFHTDEVFMIPPSKVYSSQGEDSTAKNGVVLCGHLAQGTISVGQCVVLGPFTADISSSDRHRQPEMRRSSSYSASLDSSYPRGSPRLGAVQSEDLKTRLSPVFVQVRVVSIRNLRLPVRTLLAGQVGTIGVETTTTDCEISLTRARKGLVLTLPTPALTGYRSITATFPAAEFSATSSPALLLGGHAIVYANAIRAAVKVTSLVMADSRQEPSSVFDFEDEQDEDEAQDVRITFRFVSSVEWLSIGDEVFVVPTASASGPVAGISAPGAYSGLSGFVGTACEILV